MTDSGSFDQVRFRAFLGRVLGDTAGLVATVLAATGDRLGLFKDLAAHGPATSAELAQRAGMNERYAREWLGGMYSAGYLALDGATGRFSLPPEHAPVLAAEGDKFFFGGDHQMLLGALAVADRLPEIMKAGGGVAMSAYPSEFWTGMERGRQAFVDHVLLQKGIDALPEAKAKLEAGVRVADVGCGHGRALIKLAQAYPRSTYVGFDVHAPAVARASANAEALGVADRVRFEIRDAARGLPDNHDFITTFDVVHDAADPHALLCAIRQALRPDGIYLMAEMNCSDSMEENKGPFSTLFYGFSLLYCMATSLAAGGAGLGTLGLPESKVREFCDAAGFGKVRRLPDDTPFNILYEVRP